MSGTLELAQNLFSSKHLAGCIHPGQAMTDKHSKLLLCGHLHQCQVNTMLARFSNVWASKCLAITRYNCYFHGLSKQPGSFLTKNCPRDCQLSQRDSSPS
ncbi:uncharacterized [Tachysurus ichikawai]